MARVGHGKQQQGSSGAGQRSFTDLFAQCRLGAFPRGDFLRAGDVTSAVVSSPLAPPLPRRRAAGARRPPACVYSPASPPCLPSHPSRQDRAIGRVTLRLAGSVPAANSVRLPKRQEDSLGAAGRFLYLLLRLVPGKPFAIHADVTAADRALHRLTVSNLHAGRQDARMKRSGVQVRAELRGRVAATLPQG